MNSIDELEAGVMFWAEGNPREALQLARGFGVRAGHLGVPGHYDLAEYGVDWKKTVLDDHFIVETVFCSFNGENYRDFGTVLSTVGLVPPTKRQRRTERIKEVSDFAAQLGVRSVACHIGFVPEDRHDPEYIAVCDAVAEICDHCQHNGQYFTLETGQEAPKVLLHFIEDVGRDNLKVNFDPANMVMYGTANPLEALEIVWPHVVSVHCKDGDWPNAERPESLGVEKALGEGSVGIETFVSKLKELGYRSLLTVECELPNEESRHRETLRGVELIKHLIALPEVKQEKAEKALKEKAEAP